MRNNCIEIACNGRKNSLPDVTWNSAENTFFVCWATAPGTESTTGLYGISGQKISCEGQLTGEPVTVLKTEDIVLMPRVTFNPQKNQYLLIYCLGESNFNIKGVVLDADGHAVGGHFRVTDVPANQFHYTMAYNSIRNQYCVTYNDNRNGPNNVFGVILDETGSVAHQEFSVTDAAGHQINPVVCYNPKNDTYLVNWEDFRAHGDGLADLETLEVMTDIFGALLGADGSVLLNNIPMCADSGGIDADQRFNGIAYNSRKNCFLVSWTDTRSSLKHTGLVGRIVEADGSMPHDDFVLVDAPGAQMISHALYTPGDDTYFIAFERDRNELDAFYFKDITAELAIGAMQLDGEARPRGDIISVFSGDANQRFVRFAQSRDNNCFLLVWQSDFPGVSDSVEGHIMSSGGNIMGALMSR